MPAKRVTIIFTGGTIAMRTNFENKKCVIEIEDDGPGIAEDKKSRVFDLYYTTKATGIGLGLPTVLRIVKEHNGRIDILSGKLGGALFRMELPLE